MTFIYRVMGLVASLNQRLSRTRINLVPLNWAAMGGLGVLLAISLAGWRDAHANGQMPRTMTVGQVLAHSGMDKNYVAVRGLLVPGAGIDKKGDSGSVETTWSPMLDVASKRAFLVEQDGAGTGGQAAPTTVTGMLRPLDDKLKSKIQEGGGSIDGVPLDTDYMLVEGQKPGSAALWAVGAALSSLLLALFVITFLTKYVVFQKVDRAPGALPGAEGTDVDPAQGADVRVTGAFLLDGKTSQRFLDMPSGYGTLESGETIFASNIDASNRFMGITTAKRAGTWTIVLKNGSARVGDHGLLYAGMAVRPALKLSYVEAATGKPAQAVLSFGTEGERARVLALLETSRPAWG